MSGLSGVIRQRDAAVVSRQRTGRAKQLFELEISVLEFTSPVPLHGRMQRLLDAERERAIREIIQDLRMKTGKVWATNLDLDFGYGDESFEELERLT